MLERASAPFGLFNTKKFNVMEDYIQNAKLRIEELPSHDLISSCTSLLENEDGIQKVNLENQTFSIDFNPYLISKGEIIHEIEESGIKISISEKKEKGFSKWLKKLASQNKKNLGSQKLDCCDMNH